MFDNVETISTAPFFPQHHAPINHPDNVSTEATFATAVMQHVAILRPKQNRRSILDIFQRIFSTGMLQDQGHGISCLFETQQIYTHSERTKQRFWLKKLKSSGWGSVCPQRSAFPPSNTPCLSHISLRNVPVSHVCFNVPFLGYGILLL
jgi:hypothetical protein